MLAYVLTTRRAVVPDPWPAARPQAPSGRSEASAPGRAAHRSARVGAASRYSRLPGSSRGRAAASGSRAGLLCALLLAGGCAPAVARFAVPTLTGGQWEHRGPGRPAVVSFWASWCVPCLDELRALKALHARFGDRIAFVAINVDEAPEREQARAMAAELGVSFPVGLDPDGTLLRRFGARDTIPLTLVIDARGRLAHRQDGWSAEDEPALLRAIRAAAAGQSR